MNEKKRINDEISHLIPGKLQKTKTSLTQILLQFRCFLPFNPCFLSLSLSLSLHQSSLFSNFFSLISTRLLLWHWNTDSDLAVTDGYRKKKATKMVTQNRETKYFRRGSKTAFLDFLQQYQRTQNIAETIIAMIGSTAARITDWYAFGQLLQRKGYVCNMRNQKISRDFVTFSFHIREQVLEMPGIGMIKQQDLQFFGVGTN